MQADDLNLIWKSKVNWKKRLKRFREFMICDLCWHELHEVFSRTSVINRGISRVGHFVNCVGLPPLCFPCTQDDICEFEDRE